MHFKIGDGAAGQCLMRLLHEPGLPIFKQYQDGVGVLGTDASQEAQLFQIPESEEASCRIAGGTSKLTDALAQHVGRDRIVLGSANGYPVLERMNSGSASPDFK